MTPMSRIDTRATARRIVFAALVALLAFTAIVVANALEITPAGTNAPRAYAQSTLLSGIAQVSPGNRHSCALTDTGAVQCWGDNQSGQLGNGSTADSLSPVNVTGLSKDVTFVGVGFDFSCALLVSSEVKCWGANGYLQLGNGTGTSSSVPVLVNGIAEGAASLTVGGNHACVKTTTGGAKCWGANYYGQIGDGTTSSRSSATGVQTLASGVVSIAAGPIHTCAINSAGNAQCWGENGFNQLGYTTGASSSSSWPYTAAVSIEGALKLALSQYNTCIITSSGAVKCWGMLTYPSISPTAVASLSGAVEISGGAYHLCARLSTGAVRCWGNNDQGQLGNGTNGSPVNLNSVAVTGLSTGVTDIGAGGDGSCAVVASQVRCWGRNDQGQLGDGTTANRPMPVGVSGLSTGYQRITAGSNTACAAGSSIAMKCWGSNGNGETGDGTTVSPRFTPVNVSGPLNGATSISTNGGATCAVVSGAARCWGWSNGGRLGNGTYNSSTTPVTVSGLTSNVTAISVGNNHACAVHNGAAKCWGSNTYGQLGDGTTTQTNVPVQVSGLGSGVLGISAANQHTCAYGATFIRCWGNNSSGQLGNGTFTSNLTPVNVSGLTNGIQQVSARSASTCVLTSVGGVKCWGSNSQGVLGNGSTTASNTPVDTFGISAGATSIDLSGSHACAALSTGIMCWGSNSGGQLGDGTSTTRLTPVTVDGYTQTAQSVAAGSSFSCAASTSGEVKCWGSNLSGAIGDGTFPFRSTPVNVLAGEGYAFALNVDLTGSGLGQIEIDPGNTTCTVDCSHTLPVAEVILLEATAGSNSVFASWGGDCASFGTATTCTLTMDAAKSVTANFAAVYTLTTSTSGDGSGTIARSPDQPTYVHGTSVILTASPDPDSVVTRWTGACAGTLGNVCTLPMLTSHTTTAVFDLILEDVAQVATGGSHSCARTTSGSVKCWGANWSGQLGNNSTIGQPTPVNVTGLTIGVQAVAAGSSHSCALTSSGGVRCWGENWTGQLGDNSTISRYAPMDVSGLTSGVQAISAGPYHTCALTTSGGVKCWGANWSGQLGDNSTVERLTPVDVSGLNSGVLAISAGDSHTCALMTTGGVKCWGDNSSGQLGDNSTSQRLTPVDVYGLTTVQAITAGSAHTCALTNSGGAKCWGNNGSGQLGDNSTTRRLTPVDVSTLATGVQAIAAGSSHTCTLTTSGGVKCWGNNGSGQLGLSNTLQQLAPVDVPGLTTGFQAIAAGSSHSCALSSSGRARCWGYNGDGQLGSDITAQRQTQVNVLGLSAGANAIGTGNGHSCALTSSGGVKCWGENGAGQLGDNSTSWRVTPVDVSGLTSGIQAIAVGTIHTCALTTTGGVKCWGHNQQGQLGDSTIVWRTTPVDVSGLSSGVQAISAGGFHTCALTTSGGVKCWGNNGNGQLGDNSTTQRLTPVNVSGLTSGVVAISAGYSHTCALTTSGGVKCWGNNGYGQLGDNSTTSRLAPVDVFGLNSGMQAVNAGYRHTCALTAAGGAKCWGYNGNGELGDTTTTQRHAPVDVSGLSSGVQTIDTGDSHTCAVTNTGGAKCWGNNGNGQLGDDSTSERLSPIDVSYLNTGIQAIAAGGAHTCALTTYGGVKCWGANWVGQVGDGTSSFLPTPVTVLAGEPTPVALHLVKDGAGTGTVSSLPEGISCGVDCAEGFAPDTSVTLTANPGIGSVFSGWGGDCASFGTITTCTLSLTSSKSVVATFTLNSYTLDLDIEGNGAGSVEFSSGSPAACSDDCDHTYDYNTSVTLTAVPNATTSELTGWGGACTGTGTQCTVSMTEARAVTATFSKKTWSLTTATTGSGTGSITPASGSFEHESIVELTAEATGASQFTGWGGDCASAGSATTCSLTMDAAKNATANFEAVRALNLLADPPSSGEIAVDVDPPYLNGATVNLTPSPASNYAFSHWSGGTCSGNAEPCEVTLDADKSVTANFVRLYSLQVDITGSGAGEIIPTTPDVYVDGTTVTLVAEPDANSFFMGWPELECDGNTGGEDALTCKVLMTRDRSLPVRFEAKRTLYVAFTGSAAGSGTVTYNPDADSYPEGATVQVTAVEEPGTRFMGWNTPGDCTSAAGLVCTVTMTGDRTITARFEMLYDLSTESSGAGAGSVALSEPGPYVSNSSVTATANPEAESLFVRWTGACSGSTITCVLVMDGHKTIGAQFEPIQVLSVVTSGSGVGSVTLSHAAPHYLGQTIQLTPVAEPGSAFIKWGDGDCDSVADNVCSVTLTGDHEVEAVFELPRSLTITEPLHGAIEYELDGTHLTCPNACIQSVGYGVQVSLAPVASPGYLHTDWGGACDAFAAGTACVLTLDEARVVNATFHQTHYQLTIESAHGAVTGQAPGSVPWNTEVTLEATADDGYTFSGWGTGSCDENPAPNQCRFRMTSDHTVVANYTINQYELTVMESGSGSGSVSLNPVVAGPPYLYDYNTDVTLTAEADGDSNFIGWSGGGCTGTGTCQIDMTQDQSVTAEFAIKLYDLTLTTEGEGTIGITTDPEVASAPDDIPHHTEVSLTPVASSGWSFAGWDIDCSGMLTPCEFTMDGNKSVKATFTKDNSSPVFSGASAFVVAEGASLSLPVEVTDPEDDSLTVRTHAPSPSNPYYCDSGLSGDMPEFPVSGTGPFTLGSASPMDYMKQGPLPYLVCVSASDGEYTIYRLFEIRVTHVLPTTPLWGDCNDSGTVNATDVTATILEIFDDNMRDVDPSLLVGVPEWLRSPLGTFKGLPEGCNSSRSAVPTNETINAGDLACTLARIFGRECSSAALASATENVLSVALPEVGDGDRTIGVTLSSEDGSARLAALSFALNFADAATFAGLDSVTVNAPVTVKRMVSWDATRNQLQVALYVEGAEGFASSDASIRVGVTSELSRGALMVSTLSAALPGGTEVPMDVRFESGVPASYLWLPAVQK